MLYWYQSEHMYTAAHTLHTYAHTNTHTLAPNCYDAVPATTGLLSAGKLVALPVAVSPPPPVLVCVRNMGDCCCRGDGSIGGSDLVGVAPEVFNL